MRAIDRAALELALEQTLSQPDRREQVEYMIKRDGWEGAAQFCSYHRQMETLKLKPWKTPPCWVRGDQSRDPGALALARRLDAAGISRFDPDPLAALAAAGTHPRRFVQNDSGPK